MFHPPAADEVVTTAMHYIVCTPPVALDGAMVFGAAAAAATGDKVEIEQHLSLKFTVRVGTDSQKQRP